MTDVIADPHFCPLCKKPLQVKRIKVESIFRSGSKTYLRRSYVCVPCKISVRIGRIHKRLY